MPAFSGKYYYTLDPKGRLIIPAPFREIISSNYNPKLFVVNDIETIDEHPRLPVLRRAQPPEVAHADEGRGCGPHGSEVERLLDPPDIRLGERCAAPGDLVQVTPGNGIMSSVKPMGNDIG